MAVGQNRQADTKDRCALYAGGPTLLKRPPRINRRWEHVTGRASCLRRFAHGAFSRPPGGDTTQFSGQRTNERVVVSPDASKRHGVGQVGIRWIDGPRRKSVCPEWGPGLPRFLARTFDGAAEAMSKTGWFFETSRNTHEFLRRSAWYRLCCCTATFRLTKPEESSPANGTARSAADQVSITIPQGLGQEACRRG
jgi:hypothetical protein